MKKNSALLRAAAGVTIALGLVSLAGCASKPVAASSTDAAAGKYKACMTTDTGGIDDRSFNASSWAGMQDAQAQGSASVSYVQSKVETDYAINLRKLAAEDCQTIVSVGGLMTQATQEVAAANPDRFFIQIDGQGDGKNWRGLVFNTAQSGFLSGYLAAGYSKSGVVGTFGGIQIDPVTAYMDGFWEGVQRYNADNGSSVKVLGWDESTQQGSFTGSFTDQSKGQQITNNFIQQGADVIFPVAGGAGLGAPAAASATNGKAVVIWVDTDGAESASQYSKVFLSSAVKNVRGAVGTAIEAAAGGDKSAVDYVGDLKNKGVGLAPFHDFDSKVSATLKQKLDALSQGISDGTITIASKAQPKG